MPERRHTSKSVTMAFRFLPIALLALGASALMQTDEPEEEEYFRKRGRARSLQYTRAPDATQDSVAHR